MVSEIVIVSILTFVIHLIGTLAYSVRIAGTRIGRIAISFSIFNALVLISRLSNSIQSPLIAKQVEQNILSHPNNLENNFRIYLISASIATLIGGILTPTFQRLFYKAVLAIGDKNTISKMIIKIFSPTGIGIFAKSITWPSFNNIKSLLRNKYFPLKLFVGNSISTAIWTVGVFSALYAGCLVPDLRSTAGQLSPIINGFATILIYIFIDPYLSYLTDAVVEQKVTQIFYRKVIIWFIISRFAGTLLAQLLLYPCAKIISIVAKMV